MKLAMMITADAKACGHLDVRLSGDVSTKYIIRVLKKVIKNLEKV